MKPLATIILGSLSLILVFVIAAVEKSPGTAGGGNVLIRFERDKIESIDIKKAGAEVTIQNSDGTWYLARPEQDHINPGTILALLDQLNHLTILDRPG